MISRVNPAQLTYGLWEWDHQWGSLTWTTVHGCSKTG